MKLKEGDKVTHPDFGTGEIFEVSELLGFVNIALDEDYQTVDGRIRNMVVVPTDSVTLTPQP